MQNLSGEKKRNFYRNDLNNRYISGPKNWEYLTSNSERIANWLRSFSSKHTVSNYGQRLFNFVEHQKITNPDLLLDMEVERLKAHVRAYHNSIKIASPSIAKALVLALKSLYSYYEKPELKFRRGEFSYMAHRIRGEKILTNPEVYSVASAARALGGRTNFIYGARNAAEVLYLFGGGFRDGTILRFPIKAVYEFLYPEVQFCAIIKITDEIDTKLRLVSIPYYYTGLHREALQAIRNYLDLRKKRDGGLDQNGLLFTSRASIVKPHLQTNFAQMYSRAIVSAGFVKGTSWPHLLRKSFKRVLVKAGIDPELRESMMGHRVEGVKGNYWDYHNPDIVYEVYRQADFSPSGASKIAQIEHNMEQVLKENAELRAKVEQLEKSEVKAEVSGTDIIEALNDPVLAAKLRRILKNTSGSS